MLDKLRTLQRELGELKKQVAAVETDRVAKITIRSKAEELGSAWFSEFSEALVAQQGLSHELIETYSQQFGRLIKVSAPNNLKTSYHYCPA